jgi:diadenylate cyclase
MIFLQPLVLNPLYFLKIAGEIGILYIFVYTTLYYLRETRGARILASMLTALIMLTIIAEFLEFEVIKWLLNGLWTIFAIALIVIFQPELRRAFAHLGSHSFTRKTKKKETINEVVTAAINLSNQRVGALIVFEREIGMKAIIANGIPLEARLNHYLIEAMFHTKSPLHDGGMIIRKNVIIAAHCIFPLTNDVELQKTLGTRHRAAIGITEETDAVVLVVSEETGHLSIACRGRLKQDIGPDKLARTLSLLLKMEESDSLKGIFESVSSEENNDGFSKEPLKND